MALEVEDEKNPGSGFMAVKGEKENEVSVVPGKAALDARPRLGLVSGSFGIGSFDFFEGQFYSALCVCLSVSVCPQAGRSPCARKCFIKWYLAS